MRRPRTGAPQRRREDAPLLARPALRWVSEAEGTELVNLWHLARTALVHKPLEERTSYHRMQWAAAEFHQLPPDISAGAAYKDLEAMLA